MAEVNKEIVAQLEEMLDLARAGKISGLSFFYTNNRIDKFGHIGLTDHGQLYAAARLSELALEKSGDSENGEGA